MTATKRNSIQMSRAAKGRRCCGCSRPSRYALGAALALVTSLPVAAAGFDVELAYLSDSNVTRGTGADELSDNILVVSANYTWRLPLTERTRLVVQPSVGGESYFEHDGLSNVFAGLNLQVQWRPGSGFQTPTLALFAKAVAVEYNSDMRDGLRYSAGISARTLLTDRIGLYAELGYEARSADDPVFETGTTGVAVNLDYTVARNSTIYLGLGYRVGDVVTSSSMAPVFPYYIGVPDDAFPGFYASRTDGSTQLYTLGFNHSISERHALDVAARFIRASADSGVDYDTRQFSLAYLGRF